MRIQEAQTLYVFALYDYVDESGFVTKFVGCFAAEQTDAELIANINSAFGTNIVVQDFTNTMASTRNAYINTSNYVDPTTKNNLDLVKWSEFAADKKWGYVWGTYGTVLDKAFLESKIEQYPNEVGGKEEFIRANWLGKRTADCAKNAFPTMFSGGKVCWLPYDMDTAIGINNEGALAFGYELEDIDHISSGADVYNGQDSVFWVNLRDAFYENIRSMYQQLRSDGLLSYDVVEQAYEEHQSKWPEAIWNEDAWYKYLQPLVDDNTSAYLSMLQGSKEEQRKWWLYNRFRYLDSKYNAGDSLSDFITLRGYAKADVTVEPYADIYASIKYGSYLVQTRALRGSTYTLACPLDNVNDTEIYIYSASQLKSVGDLSKLKVGYAEFSMATKLQTLKLGDASASYSNENLTELYLGNNTLLHTLDVRNCPKLGSGDVQQTVDLSGCTNIENVYFDGTTIKGCTLPNGGILKVLHLPDTITNLTIRNQSTITDFTIPGYSNISTLRLENVSTVVDSIAILKALSVNSRVRLIGVNWNFKTAAEAEAIYDVLDTMRGLDEGGNNTDTAQVSGKIHIPTLTGTELDSLKKRYTNITITYDTISFYVYYKNADGTLLYTDIVAEGGNAIDPVATGKIAAPTRANTSDIKYTYNGWGTLPTNIKSNQTVTAKYAESYAVRFYNASALLYTDWVTSGGTAKYSGSTPTKTQTAQYTYTFAGWSTSSTGSASSSALTNVTAPRNVYAAFTATVRTYTAYFYNDATLLQTVNNVAYGSSATYTGTTPVDPSGDGGEFEGWSPSPTNIKGTTTCYAQFASMVEVAEISDSWEEILASIEAGTYKTKYKVGNYKPISLGSEGTVNMQIAGFDKDTLANGSGTAAITWISKELLTTTNRMNPSIASTTGDDGSTIYTEGTGSIGGWEKCEMRTYMKSTIKPLIPETVRNAIREVVKTQQYYDTTGTNKTGQQTNDDVWLPSYDEMFSSSRPYKSLFPDDASRVKRKVGTTSAPWWWLRSTYYGNSSRFNIVLSNGDWSYNNAHYFGGVVLGFCTGSGRHTGDGSD